MNNLRVFDPSALAQLNRALIGFDRIFNDFENRSRHSLTNYPPYNILKQDEDTFEIEIAIAGFEKNDITIEVDQDELRIRGEKQGDDDQSKYVYRGLANRNFERIFTLSPHMVVGEAEMTNGILKITIQRIIPESLKPRVIDIR